MSDKFESSDDLPDSVLIARSLVSDEHALFTLYHRYANYVHRIVASADNDFDETEDCAQETWIRVIRGLPHFRAAAKFDVWLWRIAKNVVAGRRRSRSRRLRATSRISYPSATIDQPLELETIRDAVSSIPPRMRVILTLAAEGYTHAEIAVRLGIAEGTSKSQLTKARAKMRAVLASGS
jgi:RNA polymerase sigma-70 factor, ECF subfamily